MGATGAVRCFIEMVWPTFPRIGGNRCCGTGEVLPGDAPTCVGEGCLYILPLPSLANDRREARESGSTALLSRLQVRLNAGSDEGWLVCGGGRVSDDENDGSSGELLDSVTRFTRAWRRSKSEKLAESLLSLYRLFPMLSPDEALRPELGSRTTLLLPLAVGVTMRLRNPDRAEDFSLASVTRLAIRAAAITAAAPSEMPMAVPAEGAAVPLPRTPASTPAVTVTTSPVAKAAAGTRFDLRWPGAGVAAGGAQASLRVPISAALLASSMWATAAMICAFDSSDMTPDACLLSMRTGEARLLSTGAARAVLYAAGTEGLSASEACFTALDRCPPFGARS
eukprot:scaffold12181_cov213-Isochrysis_galbana.AAC.6